MPINPKDGAGPFKFESPSLAAGATWDTNLRNQTHNGKRGWFRPYLPMDDLKVYNRDVDNPVTLTVNGRYDLLVLPDTIEPFNQDAGIRYWQVVNDGTTTIDAADVVVAVAKNPWDADKAARAKGTSPPLKRAVNDLIPGGIF